MKVGEIWKLKSVEAKKEMAVIHTVIIILSIEEDNIYFQYIDDEFYFFDDPHLACQMERKQFLADFERDYGHNLNFWQNELQVYKEIIRQSRKDLPEGLGI
jgi:hypothetical protein